jgi:hypothetical protein
VKKSVNDSIKMVGKAEAPRIQITTWASLPHLQQARHITP